MNLESLQHKGHNRTRSDVSQYEIDKSISMTNILSMLRLHTKSFDM